MVLKDKQSSSANLTIKDCLPLIILIISVLCFQILGSYLANQVLDFGKFKTLWVILRIICPFAVILLLSIPIRHLYFSRPLINRQNSILLFIAFVLVLAIFAYLQLFADDYIEYYRNGRSLELLRAQKRFEGFLLFTLSTIIGWEILHRGFLLGGLQYCLSHHLRVQPFVAAVIAILFVCVFEALFHIKKPMIEALGMIIASPLLCILTIKTKSLWPALILHLGIELAFAVSVYLY